MVEEAVAEEERLAAEYRKRYVPAGEILVICNYTHICQTFSTKLEEQQHEEDVRKQKLREEIEANVRRREEQLNALREQQNREKQEFLQRKRLQQFM